jgi:pyruvate/2-oxoglutarate dehydrogenase complex dihydrolipoamide acyltransferase (E2) component
MFRQFLQRSTAQLGRTMGSPGVGVPAVRSFVTASQPTLAVIPFNLADIGEGIAEVEIMGWMISDGDEINEFDEICEVQSDKATVTITSRYTGKVTKVHYEVGELAAVGQPLISIDVEGEVATEQTKEKNTTHTTFSPCSHTRPTHHLRPIRTSPSRVSDDQTRTFPTHGWWFDWWSGTGDARSSSLGRRTQRPVEQRGRYR